MAANKQRHVGVSLTERREGCVCEERGEGERGRQTGAFRHRHTHTHTHICRANLLQDEGRGETSVISCSSEHFTTLQPGHTHNLIYLYTYTHTHSYIFIHTHTRTHT